MRHYILTRSAYSPATPIEQNHRRLALLAGVTAASLRAQTERRLTWLVLIDRDDPLLAERRAAIESADLPYILAPAERLERTMIHDRPYGPWAKHIRWGEPTLTTRLDDDDAIAPWTMERVRVAAGTGLSRVVWTLPVGYRVIGDKAYRIRWPLAQFGTLQAPPRARATIYDVNHVRVGQLGRLRPVSEEPAWLWVRHTLTRSRINVGRQTTMEGRDEGDAEPIGAALRTMFPVDWGLITGAMG